jgi:hypothetical protein
MALLLLLLLLLLRWWWRIVCRTFFIAVFIPVVS